MAFLEDMLGPRTKRRVYEVILLRSNVKISKDPKSKYVQENKKGTILCKIDGIVSNADTKLTHTMCSANLGLLLHHQCCATGSPGFVNFISPTSIA